MSGDTTLTRASLGALAGAIGVWAMDRVDWFNYGREDQAVRRRTEAARPGGMDPAHVMGGKIARLVGDRPRSPHDNSYGRAVHYGLGIGPGALYGALRGQVRGLDASRGLGFGFALFLLEDEVANPLLGTAAPPRRYPWQDHARGLVAHLVYGLVTDTSLRLLERSAGLGRRHA